LAQTLFQQASYGKEYAMTTLKRFCSLKLGLAMGMTLLLGCVAGPTLHETRRGESLPGPDMTLQPGEIRAEVVQVTPNRNEIQVRADDNRTRVLRYDPSRTRVTYQGRDYSVDNLEAGDVIAIQTFGRDSTIDTIRVQQPVQARAASTTGRPGSGFTRGEVLEGTVDRIDYDRGIFDVRTRDQGTVTVALPFNARTPDIDAFRRLRNGDSVRLEGEFVNRDNFQVSSISR
jgi:hypothetical protein